MNVAGAECQYHSLGYPERDLEERTVLEIIHLEKTL